MTVRAKPLSIDMTLTHPAVFTYRLMESLSSETLDVFREILRDELETILVSFQHVGWPDREIVVDGTERFRMAKADAHAKYTLVASM